MKFKEILNSKELYEDAEGYVQRLQDLIISSEKQAAKIEKKYKGEDVAVSANYVIKKIKEIQNILTDMEYEASNI